MNGWKDFAVVFFAPQPRIKQMCKLTWEDGESESEWEFSSVTRDESLCKHVHEWKGDLWCMNEWREIRDAVMSGEKEGGMIRRAGKLCRAECGGMRLRGLGVCVGVTVGGGGAFTDHRQRNTWENEFNTAREDESASCTCVISHQSMAVTVWLLRQAYRIGFHVVIPWWNIKECSCSFMIFKKPNKHEKRLQRFNCHSLPGTLFGIQLEIMKWFTYSLGQVLL